MRRTRSYLRERATGRVVEAWLLEQLALTDIQAAANSWAAFARSHAEVDWEHAHWDWVAKFQALSSLAGHEYCWLAMKRRQVQGMMAVELARHRSILQPGRPLVYVDYLASAPWNLYPHQRYELTGKLLLASAVQLSLRLGYGGRMALHSLPQAEAFYAKVGMRALGADRQKEGLAYFELAEEQVLDVILVKRRP